MEANILKRGLKSFTYLSFLLVLFFLSISLFAGYVFAHTSNPVYIYVSGFIMVSTIILLAFLISAVGSIFYAYYNKHVHKLIMSPINGGLDILLPIIVSLSVFFKYYKDEVRLFYVHINNIAVASNVRKLEPQKILVLLPQCLQNTDCKHRITNDIDNCRGCGKCKVKDILQIRDETGVSVVMVTGGTAALNMVTKTKPELILAVACERDLVGGIIDVRGIPVIGVVNDRPNGPCCNTGVDVSVLRRRINDFIKK